MAFVVSSLSDYVQDNRDLILKKVVFDAPSIRTASVQAGVKGSMNLNFLNVSPVFQNGASCAWNASGDATFTKRTITTGDIKVNLELCKKTLIGKWMEYQVRFGTSENALPFEEYILKAITDDIKTKMEKAVWQGDTSSSDATLARFNGWLKVLASDSAVHTVSIASGSSAWAGIQSIYAALPEEVKGGEQTIYINVSPAIFEAFTFELVNANLFHYNGDGAAREIALPGTSAIVRSTAGLVGSLKVLATYDENRVYGTDMLDDMEDVKVIYEEATDLFKIRANWNAGTQVYFPDHVAIGTFASAPSAVAGVNAALADIAASAATLASTVNEDAQIETHANS